ncbi:MAG: hypothetical protein RsTaC01_0466 [Candidatus Paraimprobicoccus trichonymphae]|uniref:Uncharacterized protein n=1 Tax=Candidatus Paraimprobicoccus trichonymphae TaxID=3033793 RepID=A0AA48I2M4_9FIRM|nr:MAG: hypothetical protein RsTaC01_0466 [Candidatus Paraimprobicoccus trichonymphae]
MIMFNNLNHKLLERTRYSVVFKLNDKIYVISVLPIKITLLEDFLKNETYNLNKLFIMENSVVENDLKIPFNKIRFFEFFPSSTSEEIYERKTGKFYYSLGYII